VTVERRGRAAETDPRRGAAPRVADNGEGSVERRGAVDVRWRRIHGEARRHGQPMMEIDPSRGADARWRGALETGDFRGVDERWSMETGEAETDPRTRSG
jgi:hypothetical protein